MHNDDESTVLVESDFHSTALNFYSHIRGSVDPRTGMYSASVELATGEGNSLRGPSFAFHLSYAALNPSDDGFGEGWALRLTSYDRAKRLLTTNTGESYVTDALQPETPATYVDRKLETFRLVPHDNARTVIIEYIDGNIEHLALPGDRGDVLKLVRVVKANGDSLTLDWIDAPGGGMRLQRVRDDDGVELLAIDYTNPDEPVLSLASGHDEPIRFTFSMVARQLRTVTMTTLAKLNMVRTLKADEASWRFTYRQTANEGMPQLWLLASVTSPQGVFEEVTYDESALRMPPGAPRPVMPAAVRRVQRRASDLRTLIEASLYSYTEANFYGYPEVDSWESARDQLIHLIGKGRFTYASTETRVGDDLTTPLITIERTYNQFHLVTMEETRRGRVVQQVETIYGDARDIPFDDQASTFQLPTKVTTTAWDTRDASIKRVTVDTKAYDEFGNITASANSASGVTETSTYYAIEGEMEGGRVLCPADPARLTRRLRSKTATPGPGAGPVRTTVYRYTDVPVLHAKRAWLNQRERYVQGSEEFTFVEPGTMLSRVQKTYTVDQGDWHGNIEEERHFRANRQTVTHYDRTSDSRSVTTITKVRSQDGPEAQTLESLQRVSGLQVASVDGLGNRTETRYDALGRKVKMTLSPGVVGYEASVTWRYQISIHERLAERIGVTNLKHRTWLDERGNVIRVDEPLDNDSHLTVHTSAWDALGQQVSDTEVDIVDGDRRIERVTAMAYDDWGQACLVTHPEGHNSVRETSLVSDASAVGGTLTRVCEWTRAGDAVTGWSTTDTNAAGLQVRSATGHWENGRRGPAEQVQTWTYDGLGRCVSLTDAVDNETLQAWDDDDRLCLTTLPDGTHVRRIYDDDSASDQLAALEVTPAGSSTPMRLGKRTRDSLGRVIHEQAGSLSTTLTYTDLDTQPTTKALPSGATLLLSHDRALGEALLSATLDDRGARTVMAEADYDTVTRSPRWFRSSVGRMDVTPDALGRLVDQRIVYGEDDRQLLAKPSPGGRYITKTLADGTLQSFAYDDAGRLVSLLDKDVAVTFIYDAFGRLSQRLSATDDGRRMMVTRTYDAHGRIEEQAWSYEGHDSPWARKLQLSWTAANKVEHRRWFDETDTLTCDEQMTYDKRGRLVDHDIVFAIESEWPRDEEGHAWRHQAFVYDAIDNLVEARTTLLDREVNVTTYTYDTEDRDKVIALQHSLPSYPGQGGPIHVQYDVAGNVIDDGMGRQFTWDGAGRLTRIRFADGRTSEYAYGPDGRIGKVTRGGEISFRYYDDGVLAFEIGGDDGRRFIRAQGGAVAETQLAAAVRTVLLLGADPQGSIIADDGDGIRTRRYEAYGASASTSSTAT